MSLLDIVDLFEKSLSFRKEVTINGFKFELTILNYAEDELISSYSNERDEDPLVYYEKTRMNVLTHAITSISDERIPDIISVKEGDKEITKERAIYIRELLRRIPPKIVDKLFDIYVDFKEEVDNKLDSDIEYKWYKTPEQREKERIEERDKRLKEEDNEDNEDNEDSSAEASIEFRKIEENDEEEIK